MWSLGYLIIFDFMCQSLFLWKTSGMVFVQSLLIIVVFHLLSVFSSFIWQLCFYLLLSINHRKLNCVFVTGYCIFTCAELFYGSYQTFAEDMAAVLRPIISMHTEEQRAVQQFQDTTHSPFTVQIRLPAGVQTRSTFLATLMKVWPMVLCLFLHTVPHTIAALCIFITAPVTALQSSDHLV